jgi:hypothetical protein
MLQILSYLPGLNCYIPFNLEVFLTIKDVAIPFNMLPDFPFSPLELTEYFMTDPLTEKLSTIGYESISFIFNFSDEIVAHLLSP